MIKMIDNALMDNGWQDECVINLWMDSGLINRGRNQDGHLSCILICRCLDKFQSVRLNKNIIGDIMFLLFSPLSSSIKNSKLKNVINTDTFCGLVI